MRPRLLARRRRPNLYPPRGSVVRGRGGPGQPPSPYLVGSAPLSGRAAMNGAGPAPAQRGRPAHVRQARGSAAPAAAWPNREPRQPPGVSAAGQGPAGAGKGRGRRARSAARPRGQQPPVPDQVRSFQLVMLGLGGGCEGSRTGVFSPGFSFFHEKKRPVGLLFNQRVMRILPCQQLRLLSCMEAASALCVALGRSSAHNFLKTLMSACWKNHPFLCFWLTSIAPNEVCSFMLIYIYLNPSFSLF